MDKENTTESISLDSNRYLKLLDFIELCSENSRWSTAITLLISITVASLIALIGSYTEYHNPNYFFYTETTPDTCVVTFNRFNVFCDSSINTAYKDSSSLRSINNDSLISINICPSNHSVESEANNKFSAYQILFACTTLLGFVFTLFFYILRQNFDRDLEKVKKTLTNANTENTPLCMDSIIVDIKNYIEVIKNEFTNEEQRDDVLLFREKTEMLKNLLSEIDEIQTIWKKKKNNTNTKDN